MDLQFWRGQRVLITGGSGFIGSHLTDRLAESGAELTVVAHSYRSESQRTSVTHERINFVRGDLCDGEFAARCMRNQDIVLHFASRIAGLGYNSHHPAEMMSYNAILDLQVLRAAACSGVRLFFYPSGALVYDRNVPTPITEDASVTGDPVAACKGAAWAKRLCERAIPFFREEHGMHTVVARFSNIYGPGDDFAPDTAHLVGNTIRLVANDEAPQIWGDGSALRSYLYVTSAVDAILVLVERGATDGPINIGGQREYTVKDIVRLILEVSGKTLRPIFHPERPTGLDRKLLDITRFRDLTGFTESVPLKEGLQRTYEWYVARRQR